MVLPLRVTPSLELTPTPYALYAASGPDVEVPLILIGSDYGPIIDATNTGSGYGFLGEATDSDGVGVYGWHSATSGPATY